MNSATKEERMTNSEEYYPLYNAIIAYYGTNVNALCHFFNSSDQRTRGNCRMLSLGWQTVHITEDLFGNGPECGVIKVNFCSAVEHTGIFLDNSTSCIVDFVRYNIWNYNRYRSRGK
jgi:hypothetical protein